MSLLHDCHISFVNAVADTWPRPSSRIYNDHNALCLVHCNRYLDMDFSSIRAVDALLLTSGVWLVYGLLRSFRRRARTTKLKGPRSSNWLLGVTAKTFNGDFEDVHEAWAKEHGDVFQVPGVLGDRRVILVDPKAISHFYKHETIRFVQAPASRNFFRQFVSVSSL